MSGERRPWSAATGIGTVLVLVLVALSLGRFLLGPDDGTATAPVVTSPPALTSTLTSAEIAESVAALEAAAAARPQDPTGWQRVGTAAVQALVRTLDPAYGARAERAFDQAEVLAPGDPATLVGQAGLALTQHRFEDALGFATDAVAQRPEDALALAALVDAQVELGHYEEVGVTVQRLLDRRPALPALSRASYLRELHGDLDGALLAMVQAEAAGGGARLALTGPADAFDLGTVVALQGDILLLAGRETEAAERYERATTLAPTLGAAQIGLARVEAATGRREAAVRRLADLVERAPTLAAAALLGDLELASGREDAAGDAFELARAVTALQRSSGALVDLEAAHFEADHGGDPALALALALAAYEARATVHTADALAWALHRGGRDAEALAYVEESLRLGTRDPTIRFHAAAVLAATGQVGRAADELGLALDAPALLPVHPTVAAEVVALADQLGVPLPPALRAPPSVDVETAQEEQ